MNYTRYLPNCCYALSSGGATCGAKLNRLLLRSGSWFVTGFYEQVVSPGLWFPNGLPSAEYQLINQPPENERANRIRPAIRKPTMVRIWSNSAGTSRTCTRLKKHLFCRYGPSSTSRDGSDKTWRTSASSSETSYRPDSDRSSEGVGSLG